MQRGDPSRTSLSRRKEKGTYSDGKGRGESGCFFFSSFRGGEDWPLLPGCRKKEEKKKEKRGGETTCREGDKVLIRRGGGTFYLLRRSLSVQKGKKKECLTKKGRERSLLGPKR